MTALAKNIQLSEKMEFMLFLGEVKPQIQDGGNVNWTFFPRGKFVNFFGGKTFLTIGNNDVRLIDFTNNIIKMYESTLYPLLQNYLKDKLDFRNKYLAA